VAEASLKAFQAERTRLEETRTRVNQLRAEVDEARAELERVRTDRDQFQARLAAAEKARREESQRPGAELELRGAVVREQALQQERERLSREVDELKGLLQSAVDEGHQLRVQAAEAKSLRGKLALAEGELAQREQLLAGMRATDADRVRSLDQTRAQLIEQSARSTARSAAEARMFKELSERQGKELDELRVQWARASTELDRLKAAHQTLQADETGARSQLEKLKEGKGILAASDLVEAMGVDLERVRMLEQRIRELEVQLASRS
jgi:chromosome segregation ATPase